MPPTNNGQQGPTRPVMDVQRAPTPPPQPVTPQSPVVPSQPSLEVPPIPQEMLGTVPQAKKKSHLVAIVIAVLIAVLIITGSIFAFVVSRDSSEPTPPAAPQVEEQTPAVSEGTATPESIDQINKVIDQQLNSVNDQQDFTPNDISDESLGL